MLFAFYLEKHYEWIESLLSYIHRVLMSVTRKILLIILTLTIVNEIGFLCFSPWTILLFFISYQYGPLSSNHYSVGNITLRTEIGATFSYFAARGLGSRSLTGWKKRSARRCVVVEI